MQNVNVESMDAQVFYEQSLLKQREMVNKAIGRAMDKCSPVVKLPTLLYDAISKELHLLGWEEDIVEHEMYVNKEDGISCIYPNCIDGRPSFLDTRENNTFISAEKFYSTTITQQRRYLLVALNEAISNGLSEVKLTYKAYPQIIKEMNEKGWEHLLWYADCETKEECSMFYPVCGFAEEEE